MRERHVPNIQAHGRGRRLEAALRRLTDDRVDVPCTARHLESPPERYCAGSHLQAAASLEQARSIGPQAKHESSQHERISQLAGRATRVLDEEATACLLEGIACGCDQAGSC
eukprot:7388880-Prymnesium_polylepis.1